MNEINRSVAKREARGQAGSRKKGEFLLFHCLVVSVDEDRRQMLAEAASHSGWETVAVSDLAGAGTYLRRGFLQLAIVDLQSDYTGELFALVEQLSSERGVLSIVCGHHDDADEEINVRQAGAWLYLPGVEEHVQLSLLCGEARHIVERLHAANSAPSEKLKIRRAQ